MFSDLANAVRFLSISEVGEAKSGHLGMPLGAADFLTVLFKDFLIFDPKNPQWPNRDRFVLSGGHGSAALYALLYLTGYEKISLNDLKMFRKPGSKATGHPEYDISCGIEATTGLLGQGIANAVGMAIEERLLNARLGDDCINHYTYVCVGDGDLMEGISHEASSIAGHLSLGRLIVLFDDNNITIDGEVSVSSGDNVLKRYESYGWHVQSVDGHSESEIFSALGEAKKDQRPSLISFKTKIGFGSSRENTPQAHGGALSKSETEEIKKKLNWFWDPFEVPEDILKTWRAAGMRHHENCKKWYETQFSKYGSAEFEFTDSMKKALRSLKKDCFVSRPFEATRISSKNIIEKIMETSNFVLSGSADL
ncbi:MAG: transketolase, partial [Holosporaceae bacterium]|nr:transketolase [Holosporaceae bacterium]